MATSTRRQAIAGSGRERRVRQLTFVQRHRWITPLFAAMTDALFVWLAFVVAYWLRYRLELGGTIQPGFSQPFSFFISKALILVVISVAIFRLRGLYNLPRWTSFLDESSVILSGATTAMAVVILFSFLQRFYPSRLIFIYAWLIMIGLLLLKRLATRTVREMLWARGIGVDRVLVIGAGPAGRRYMEHILNSPQVGYRLVGFVDDVPVEDSWAIATERRVVRPDYLGRLAAIPTVVQEQDVDEVVIALPPNAHEQVMPILEQCRREDVAFTLVPDLYELAIDRVITYEVGGLPLIRLKESRILGWNYALKRAMDIAIASIVVLLTLPLMVIIAIAIKLDSPGPIFFPQERVGKNWRRFTLYKFRTMSQDAEKMKAELQAAHNVGDLLFKLKDDPRRTRVGRILRTTSLDELPQFFNILIGVMSVVGPRPQVPAEVDNYEEWHCRRLEVTPGLTGLWQVNGRSDLSFDEMVRLDVYYAEHWSPWLDVKLILRTIPAVLLARGAY
ncbi:MAG TPA: undecaprenyl-phosphate glucose phosphotransferase [Nitrolancea sp.]|nr:undecaprenyl-phosphate glucose phosphotransferase [Nitrolancea sp.]